MPIKSTPLLKHKRNARFQRLEKEVVSLRDRLATLEQAMPTVVPIDTLAPERYEVLKPFHVVVRPHGDEYTASFVEANINASGDTIEEAVRNVKDVILATFEDLLEHGESQLGPGPLRQVRVLQAFIRKPA